ncbi:hypothetical protein BG011_001734, partial [Mortierella polycephala]
MSSPAPSQASHGSQSAIPGDTPIGFDIPSIEITNPYMGFASVPNPTVSTAPPQEHQQDQLYGIHEVFNLESYPLEEDRDRETTFTQSLTMAKSELARYQVTKQNLAARYCSVTSQIPHDQDRPQKMAQISQDYRAQDAAIQATMDEVIFRIKSLTTAWENMNDDSALHPELASSKSSSPQLDELGVNFDVKMDPTIPQHASLCRVYKWSSSSLVPVLDRSTKELDFNRIPPLVFADAPILEFKFPKVDPDTLTFDFIKQVIDFLISFKSFYQSRLTKDLFHDVAWTYMSGALRKVEADRQFEYLIRLVPIRQRRWKKIESCLMTIFRFNVMKKEIVTQLCGIKPKTGEDMHSYVDRIEGLISASRASDMDQTLVITITASLSDSGQAQIANRFQKDLQDIDLKSLLAYMRSDDSLLHGKRSDSRAWVMDKHVPQSAKRAIPAVEHDYRLGSKRARSSSDETASRPRNQGYTARGDNSRAQTERKPFPTNRDLTQAQWPCRNTECYKYNRHHKDNECFRHSRPDKFTEMNSRAANRAAGGNRSHNMTYSALAVQVAQLQAEVEVAKQTRMIDTIGQTEVQRTTEDFNNMEVETPSFPYTGAINMSALSGPIYFNAFRGPEEGDDRISVPITIKGQKYTALLDSGAQISAINEKVAADLNIKKGENPNAFFILVEGHVKKPCVITCDRIPLSCNGRSYEWQVGVLNLGYYDFLIGMDLFGRFGFHIEGFRPIIPERRDIYVTEDEKPSLIPDIFPEREREPEYIIKKEQFQKKIERELNRNRGIDPKSHCELDIMRVELKTQSGCTIQEHSRRFYAQVEKEEVDNTVNKWLENGVIVRAPKVDTDNFPLPIISEILEKAAGHKFYSTIDLSQAYHRLPLAED